MVYISCLHLWVQLGHCSVLSLSATTTSSAQDSDNSTTHRSINLQKPLIQKAEPGSLSTPLLVYYLFHHLLHPLQNRQCRLSSCNNTTRAPIVPRLSTCSADQKKTCTTDRKWPAPCSPTAWTLTTSRTLTTGHCTANCSPLSPAGVWQPQCKPSLPLLQGTPDTRLTDPVPAPTA